MYNNILYAIVFAALFSWTDARVLSASSNLKNRSPYGVANRDQIIGPRSITVARDGEGCLIPSSLSSKRDNLNLLSGLNNGFENTNSWADNINNAIPVVSDVTNDATSPGANMIPAQGNVDYSFLYDTAGPTAVDTSATPPGSTPGDTFIPNKVSDDPYNTPPNIQTDTVEMAQQDGYVRWEMGFLMVMVNRTDNRQTTPNALQLTSWPQRVRCSSYDNDFHHNDRWNQVPSSHPCFWNRSRPRHSLRRRWKPARTHIQIPSRGPLSLDIAGYRNFNTHEKLWPAWIYSPASRYSQRVGAGEVGCGHLARGTTVSGIQARKLSDVVWKGF